MLAIQLIGPAFVRAEDAAGAGAASSASEISAAETPVPMPEVSPTPEPEVSPTPAPEVPAEEGNGSDPASSENGDPEGGTPSGSGTESEPQDPAPVLPEQPGNAESGQEDPLGDDPDDAEPEKEDGGKTKDPAANTEEELAERLALLKDGDFVEDPELFPLIKEAFNADDKPVKISDKVRARIEKGEVRICKEEDGWRLYKKDSDLCIDPDKGSEYSLNEDIQAEELERDEASEAAARAAGIRAETNAELVASSRS